MGVWLAAGKQTGARLLYHVETVTYVFKHAQLTKPAHQRQRPGYGCRAV